MTLSTRQAGLTLTVLGLAFIAVGLLADIAGARTIGVGRMQVAAVVIGGLLLLTGAVEQGHLRREPWLPLLATIYLGGLIVIGTWPVPHHRVVVVDATSPLDLILNLIGFVPFAYLLAANCQVFRGQMSRTLPVLIALLLSGIIELTQGVAIPGRYASLLDWLLNGAGAVIGAGLSSLVARGRHPDKRERIA